MQYRVGVDLGTTNIRIGIIDKDFKILNKNLFKTDLPRSHDKIIKDIIDGINQTLDEINISSNEIHSIGVGSPGTANSLTGIIEFASSLGFKNVDIRKKLEQVFNKDIYIGNHADAAAYAETIAGVAKNVKNCVFVTIGTSISSGIIMEGKIYRGFGNMGVELGHMVIVHNGERCSCGRKGCWEEYASAKALINQTKKVMVKHPESLLWTLVDGKIENVAGRTAFRALESNDPVGQSIIKKYIDYIGCGLTNIINAYHPEVICIGGAICKEGDTIITPLKEHVEKEQYARNTRSKTKLRVASLKNDAGMIGAAFLSEVKKF